MSRELEGLSLLNYQREENDEHGGKEPRSAQVGDWMPILTIQPNLTPWYLVASASQSPAGPPLECTQETALPMVCGLLPLLNTIY
jgi:hypothetical protein